jgi:tRNA(Ile)-lysidine synthase
MIEEFRRYIADNKLFSADEKILLAVSGGIDSMVMVHLFLRCGFEFGIAHCNFNLRGNESDGDETFVGKFSEDHKISFFSNRFETESYSVEKGLSIQMAARELRYQWFEDIRNSEGYHLIALAHNLNDNIETFLINLVRGSGIAGFAGIPPRNERLIRPLLFASRSEIREYCDKYEIKYREDSSNADTKYVRNKIRHLIVPVLKEINPAFEKTIEETIARITEVNEIYSEHISSLRRSLIKENRIGYSVALDEIINLTPLNTMIFELFRGFGITRTMIPEFVKLASAKSGSQLITCSHRFIKNREEILIVSVDTAKERYFVYNCLDELREDSRLGRISVVGCTSEFNFPGESDTSCLSLNKLKFPLIARSWRHGDYFYPLGMNKRKKLSDFFIDNKFSIPEKENAMVLETDGKIACIIGVRTDNRFRITRSTTKCLVIESKDKRS